MVDCKICEHPYCQYAGEQRGFVINCTNYMPRQKPQTNADRIRAMSDEELAEFRAGGHCPPSRRFPNCATIEPCSKCWLEYLRQPVKDGENE